MSIFGKNENETYFPGYEIPVTNFEIKKTNAPGKTKIGLHNDAAKNVKGTKKM